MKRLLLLCCVFFPIQVFGNTFTELRIDEHIVQYITYSTQSSQYDIHIGISESGSTLREIMQDTGGVTAINGIFFCPADYSQCQGKNYTINERFVQGQEISTYKSTGERVVFGWDISKSPFLYQTDKIHPEKRGDIYNGLANFPLLLQSGENKLEHYYDIGLIDKKMRIPLDRHFICTTPERDQIIFGRVSDANLDQVVKTVLKIGCYDAINLDAGKSSSFIYNGRNIVGPGRNVLDGIVISRKDFNTSLLDSEIQILQKKLEKIYFLKRDKKKAVEKLSGYRTMISKTRRIIYEKNSKDIINKEMEVIGYELHIESLSTLKKVYILNSIDTILREIILELQRDM